MKRLVDEVPTRVKEKLAWWVLRSRARGAGFDRGGLRRVEEYLRVSLELQEPRYTHPLQRPRHYFPGLTAKPWHDRTEFTWVALLEDAHEVIEEELAHIQSRLLPQPQGLADSGRWNIYYFYSLGRKVEENCLRCPETARVIDSLSGLSSTGLAYFSVLTPGTHIKPHCGPTNTRLRCHLGLDVPPTCQIRVGSETRSWEKGKCLIFDDSFEHEVRNSADETRTVLVLDFWHPDLTAAEVWALRQIMRVSTKARKFDRSVRRNSRSATATYS
ncbi:MAG: aspartyl/asparaginyl beta-hydroxylase domain-containing protein [Pyrinomonadaceae bacterium]